MDAESAAVARRPACRRYGSGRGVGRRGARGARRRPGRASPGRSTGRRHLHDRGVIAVVDQLDERRTLLARPDRRRTQGGRSRHRLGKARSMPARRSSSAASARVHGRPTAERTASSDAATVAQTATSRPSSEISRGSAPRRRATRSSSRAIASIAGTTWRRSTKSNPWSEPAGGRGRSPAPSHVARAAAHVVFVSADHRHHVGQLGRSDQSGGDQPGGQSVGSDADRRTWRRGRQVTRPCRPTDTYKRTRR